jgi:ATP-dependent protease ClpP protease subunit
MSSIGYKRRRIDSDDQRRNIDEPYYYDLELEKMDEPERIPLSSLVYAIGTEIHFSAGIDKMSIQEMIRLITTIVNDNVAKYIGTADKLTITYIVDSPGGSVTSILKFVDFLKIIKDTYKFVEFVSVITGLTASAGTIMAIVADKRYMTTHAYAMIHELSSSNNGTFTHMKSYSKFLERMHDDLVDIYISKTKMDRGELEKLLNDETWLSAEKYKELKFVDEIK